jgi:UDP-N-acetylmuramate--alanine ligase
MNDDADNLHRLLTGGPARVHLVGVAGSGMSGIAALLLSLGHRVSGCDRVTSVEVERLRALGLEFHTPQDGTYLDPVEVVVYSSAIRAGNPAFDAARRLGKPMVRRAEALAALIRAKRGIVVAGMHGKTTTSALAAHVLRAGGLRPSHYVGAEIPVLGTNAHWDPAGEHFVAEGDESDGTIALYHPEHAILLNIEEEHLDHYRDLAAIEETFRKFLSQVRGAVFYCIDDPHAARLCAGLAGAVSFGRDARADYHCREVVRAGFRWEFEVVGRGRSLGRARLGIPGEHNVSNALGVVALASELGVPFDRIASALESFRGARRRFEIKHESARHMVVDDYGHHPSEIRATVATARTCHAGGRVLVLFQPHRYTRTRALREGFGRAFADADFVCVADVYPAGEAPIEGVSGQSVVDAMRENGQADAVFEPRLARAHLVVGNRVRTGDLVLSLGAGNVHEEASILARDLRSLERFEEVMGPGEARLYEPLARHTTLRVGGPAQFWLEPETEAGFAALVTHCRQENLPLLVIGRGSNLLVRDGGIRGAVVRLARGEFARLSVDGCDIEAGVGVRFRQISAAAKAAGLSGFEWMEGIPGNAGGGLRMNAGAMGAQTFDQVVEVRYLDTDGSIRSARPSELDVRYRSVPWFGTHYALSVRFRGQPGDPAEIARRIDASLEKRRRSQPAAASAGCIFKNPAQTPAGKLVEELGLKGLAVGGARVSDVHGNFIVNDGGASARDVLALIQQVSRTARERRGIELETEVQIVGEEDPS